VNNGIGNVGKVIFPVELLPRVRLELVAVEFIFFLESESLIQYSVAYSTLLAEYSMIEQDCYVGWSVLLLIVPRNTEIELVLHVNIYVIMQEVGGKWMNE